MQEKPNFEVKNRGYQRGGEKRELVILFPDQIALLYYLEHLCREGRFTFW